MPRPLDRLTIEGFKSIRSLRDFRLSDLNILIGANGAGKSNFVDFFRLLEEMSVGNLAGYALARGADSLFYNGPKHTPEIGVQLFFGRNGYRFLLKPTATESVFVSNEASAVNEDWRWYSGAQKEARLTTWGGPGGTSDQAGERNVCGHIFDSISSWRVYHFHDTSTKAPLRRSGEAQDVSGLRSDGENIAPLLLHIQIEHPLIYQRIVGTIQLVAPYFDDFILRPRETADGKNTVRLEWKQVKSTFPFTAAHLSDGTLRFIALATALLQPDPPATLIIDEPELGLHPFALKVLGSLLAEASTRMQVVVATQSPMLLDDVDPENVVVIGRNGEGTTFTRLSSEQLGQWVDEYSLGELWTKNVIDAGPDYV